MLTKTRKAILKIGYLCNHKCIFCHTEDKKGFFNVNLKLLFCKILILKKKGIEVILLSGGEATLEKHFLEIVNFIKKQGLSFGIVTNGSTIGKKDFFDKLFNLGLKNIYLSLHGTYDIHNEIVKNKNSFNDIINIISYLKQNNEIELFFNFVVNTNNFSDIEHTIEFLLSTGYHFINIKFSLLQMKGLAKDSNLALNPILVAEKIKSFINKYKDFKIKLFWDGFPICLFTGYEKYNSDLNTENIEYISEADSNELKPAGYGKMFFYEECNKCLLKEKCYGIEKDYILNYSFKDSIKPII